MKKEKFTFPSSDGSPWGIVSAENLWANVYAIKYNKPENSLDQKIWFDLFNKAKTAALNEQAQTIFCRVQLAYQPEVFRNILETIGFYKKAGRIEYKLEVDKLPDGKDTPITWKSVLDLCWSELQLPAFTKEIISNTLDCEPDENPKDFIQDWLVHQELTHGFECIHIGFINGTPCALVVAQVNKQDGWSRLSYLGLIPAYRNQGLGRWVHTHGFQMMKDQGGKLYYGGTHSENFAMQRLFVKHGCREICQMEEWHYLASEVV